MCRDFDVTGIEILHSKFGDQFRRNEALLVWLRGPRAISVCALHCSTVSLMPATSTCHPISGVWSLPLARALLSLRTASLPLVPTTSTRVSKASPPTIILILFSI
jgi:hypothetical protein